MQALFEQNARHIGGHAESDINRGVGFKFHRHAPRNHLGYAEFHRGEISVLPPYFPRNRRVIKRFCGLHLFRRHHDVVDQNAGDMHLERRRASRLHRAFHLRNHHAAVVAHRKRLFQRAQIRAFVFITQVAALIGAGCANNPRMGNDGRKVKPFLVVEFDPADDGFCRGRGIHRAAFVRRVDKRVQTHLGEHPGALCGRFAVDVKKNARWDVVGGHAVVLEHLPNARRRRRGWRRRIRAANGGSQEPVLRQMVDAFNPAAVARGDGVQGGYIRGRAFGAKARANRRKHRIRAAKSARRRHRDNRVITNQFRRLVRGNEFARHRGCFALTC